MTIHTHAGVDPPELVDVAGATVVLVVLVDVVLGRVVVTVVVGTTMTALVVGVVGVTLVVGGDVVGGGDAVVDVVGSAVVGTVVRGGNVGSAGFAVVGGAGAFVEVGAFVDPGVDVLGRVNTVEPAVGRFPDPLEPQAPATATKTAPNATACSCRSRTLVIVPNSPPAGTAPMG